MNPVCFGTSIKIRVAGKDGNTVQNRIFQDIQTHLKNWSEITADNSNPNEMTTSVNKNASLKQKIDELLAIKKAITQNNILNDEAYNPLPAVKILNHIIKTCREDKNSYPDKIFLELCQNSSRSKKRRQLKVRIFQVVEKLESNWNSLMQKYVKKGCKV